MRIGVYLGRWSLHQLGGMGVYVQNLLRGVASLDQREHELLMLVDRANRPAARGVPLCAAIVPLVRPEWGELTQDQRAKAIRVRRMSYRSLDAADALRGMCGSAAVDAYLWGLDDAVAHHGIDLLYFTLPPYLKRPRVPVLLTIHDLKHVHRPQDHSPGDLARRRRWSRVARSAALVYASYEHVRRDIEHHCRVPAEQTAVLPLACPSEISGSVNEPARSFDFDLPDRFVLMPAQLWPHKNHERVVRAVAHLHDSKNLRITILCTGQTGGECSAHAERIARLAGDLGLGDLVRLIGFVDRPTLRALYLRARLILVASLYEPGSFPAMEALALGKPLAASRVTSIPETVGDAALLFDPTSTNELADALARLWTDDALCHRLEELGPQEVRSRTWRDVGREWLALCEQAHVRNPAVLEGVR
ncbi:MAG: glycosyltransferase family 4 protein [Phycisphaerae bacterium]